MEKLIIREMKPKDAKVLNRIKQDITRCAVETDFRDIIKNCSKDDVALVAELDGKVVGYMITHIVYGGFGVDKGAWIANFGVDPKYMGQGIGKALANEIFRMCKEKGIKFIYTSVRWDSVDLLSFFKTLGFDRSEFINLRKEIGK